MNAFAIAALALAQMALSPVAPPPAAAHSDDTLTVSLCSGGVITIKLGRDPDGSEDKQNRDCNPMGCHAATCREKHKLIPAPRNLI